MNTFFILNRISFCCLLLTLSTYTSVASNTNPTDVAFVELGAETSLLHGDAEPGEKRTKTTKNFVFYTVSNQDKSIYGISQKFGVPLKQVFKANKWTKKKPIKVGDLIYIPKKHITKKVDVVADKPVKETTPITSITTPSYKVHVLEKGETLSVLKRKYGVSLKAIEQANPNLDPDHVAVGTDVRIPSGTSSSIAPSSNKTVSAPQFVKQEYFYYKIVSGDSYLNLQGRFGVTKSELVELNPVLREGFKTGIIIRVPKQVNKKAVDPKTVPHLRYKVKYGDTVEDIAQRHSSSVEEIKKINSELKYRDVIAGEVILLPNPDYSGLGGGLINDCSGFDASNMTRPFQIGLFLPLYFDENRTVNNILSKPDENGEREVIGTRRAKIVYKKSVNFLHFYEGVLLALDSLRAQGMNVELSVFDTDKNIDKVKALMTNPEMKKMDLFIGPVYNSLQGPVASIASSNRIPMVSPLTSDEQLTGKNPYYYQVNPTTEVQERYLADYVVNHYTSGNYVVLQMKENETSSLMNRLRDRLYGGDVLGFDREFSFVSYNYKTEGVYGLEYVLQPDRENIIMIPSTREAEISQLIGQLTGFVNEYQITLVGMSNWTKKSSIKLESLHKLNTIFLSFYHPDYTIPEMKSMVGKFRSIYKTEPNKFSFQGYDIAYYFGSALAKYGKGFEDCLVNHKVQLTQSDYRFMKVSGAGGYMNQAFKVIQFGNDYELHVKDALLGNEKPVLD